jgi:hypothetical protein
LALVVLQLVVEVIKELILQLMVQAHQVVEKLVFMVVALLIRMVQLVDQVVVDQDYQVVVDQMMVEQVQHVKELLVEMEVLLPFKQEAVVAVDPVQDYPQYLLELVEQEVQLLLYHVQLIQVVVEVDLIV